MCLMIHRVRRFVIYYIKSSNESSNFSRFLISLYYLAFSITSDHITKENPPPPPPLVIIQIKHNHTENDHDLMVTGGGFLYFPNC